MCPYSPAPRYLLMWFLLLGMPFSQCQYHSHHLRLWQMCLPFNKSDVILCSFIHTTSYGYYDHVFRIKIRTCDLLWILTMRWTTNWSYWGFYYNWICQFSFLEDRLCSGRRWVIHLLDWLLIYGHQVLHKYVHINFLINKSVGPHRYHTSLQLA